MVENLGGQLRSIRAGLENSPPDPGPRRPNHVHQWGGERDEKRFEICEGRGRREGTLFWCAARDSEMGESWNEHGAGTARLRTVHTN